MRRPGTGGPGRQMTYEQLQEINNIIVGSPETVTRKLANTIDQLSPGYLILIGSDGTLPTRTRCAR